MKVESGLGGWRGAGGGGGGGGRGHPVPAPAPPPAGDVPRGGRFNGQGVAVSRSSLEIELVTKVLEVFTVQIGTCEDHKYPMGGLIHSVTGA